PHPSHAAPPPRPPAPPLTRADPPPPAPPPHPPFSPPAPPPLAFTPSFLHELKTETPLDAQVARGDAVVEGRRHLHDPVVLHVQLQHAADPAVRTHRLGDRLLRLVPRPRGTHVVLALEHQRPRRADADAVAAVDACRVGQPNLELGRDVRVESAPGDADGKCVLRIDPARLDALVAEAAARVVAHVQLVVDLHRLRHRYRPRAKARGDSAIARHPSVYLRGAERHVDRRAQQLEHQPPRVPHALRIGADLHPR